jgi:hypothetical protein
MATATRVGFLTSGSNLLLFIDAPDGEIPQRDKAQKTTRVYAVEATQ